MAQNVKPKGSIILKLLILILAVGLIATILYPKSLWMAEAEKTDECRKNMYHLLHAELVFLGENNTYSESVDSVIAFILDDTTNTLLTRYANQDSVLSEKIFDVLKANSLAESIIDSLAEFGRKRDLDTTQILILDSLRTYPEFKQVVDSVTYATLNNFNNCPTTGKSFKLTVVDTSQIKHLLIECPLDSMDIVESKNNFLLHKLGGLTIENHGNIEDGEISW